MATITVSGHPTLYLPEPAKVHRFGQRLGLPLDSLEVVVVLDSIPG